MSARVRSIDVALRMLALRRWGRCKQAQFAQLIQAEKPPTRAWYVAGIIAAIVVVHALLFVVAVLTR